jgi:hypothetical protein
MTGTVCGVRFPPEVVTRIRERARRNKRSLGGEIRYLAELGAAAEDALMAGEIDMEVIRRHETAEVPA